MQECQRGLGSGGLVWVLLLLMETVESALNWTNISQSWGRWMWVPWTLAIIGQLLHIVRVFVAGVLYGEAEQRFFKVE